MYKKIDKDILAEMDVLNEGTHAYIIRGKDGHVYKVYKKCFKNGQYCLELKETRERLEYIVSKKEQVQKSKLPLHILEYNGYPIGVEIEYFEDCVTLKEYLMNNMDADINQIKQTLLDILNELIENNIVPTDPHFENFLVRRKGIQIEILSIDLDDIDVFVFPNNKYDIFKESSISACYSVIDKSFEILKSGIRQL